MASRSILEKWLSGLGSWSFKNTAPTQTAFILSKKVVLTNFHWIRKSLNYILKNVVKCILAMSLLLIQAVVLVSAEKLERILSLSSLFWQHFISLSFT